MMCAIPVTLVKAEPPNWGLLRETYNISYHVLLSLADKRSRAHAWWLALRRELRDVVLSCTLRLASPSHTECRSARRAQQALAGLRGFSHFQRGTAA